MEDTPFEERKKLLFEIIEKHSPTFKYELTRQHLSEDQIEAIYPIFMIFLEKVLHELSIELRNIKYSSGKDKKSR